MIETEKYGTYHATNEDTCTWYEFAKEIFNQANINIKVNPILASDYPTKAKRPKNS
jgi:dTDP-4-dehydrorhamnose reductase